MDRGATFLIIGASITRQFEFLQRVWVNDGTGIFTIPAQTVAPAGEGLPRFMTTRPASTFFIPGIRALQWTAEGP